jgi:phage recombination protein Bet
MARELRKQEVADAVKAYAAKVGKEVSINDQGGMCIMPGDILVSCSNDGKLECNDPATKEAIAEILMELPVEAKAGRLPENKAIMPKGDRSSYVGQMKPVSGAVRDIQVANLTMDDIKQYLCPKATDQEAFMFLKLCQARGMNPFLKEAYLIKYSESNPATMVVGKDHFTKVAENNPQFDGFEAGVILKTSAGLERREGTFYLDDEELVGGWAKVWRKDRKMPFFNEVRLKDFARYTASKKSPWDTMEGVMIRKVPLVQSLREAFPNDFVGCYDESEMGIDPSKEVA